MRVPLQHGATQVPHDGQHRTLRHARFGHLGRRGIPEVVEPASESDPSPKCIPRAGYVGYRSCWVLRRGLAGRKQIVPPKYLDRSAITEVDRLPPAVLVG